LIPATTLKESLTWECAMVTLADQLQCTPHACPKGENSANNQRERISNRSIAGLSSSSTATMPAFISLLHSLAFYYYYYVFMDISAMAPSKK
jgi:hypothetical protein